MLPIVAIVGRPNVGKSTLFNRLSKKRNALVDDTPGVTRDRLYAHITWKGKKLLIVDTGGFDSYHQDLLADGIKRQVEIAVKEADLLLLLFDGKTGPVSGDEELLKFLRRTEKKIICAVNKIDGPEKKDLSMEFFSLGMKELFAISSAHGYGINHLMEQIVKDLPDVETDQDHGGQIRIALIGRPNVGKSSLVNRIIGSERLLVSETPGTTRDSVDISFERDGKSYLLIDTAGIRRRSKVKEKIEKFSIIKSLKTISRSHISVILIDSKAGIYEQDARICGYALDEGRGMIMAFNKWDLVRNDPFCIKSINNSIDRQLRFISFVPRINISALTGERVRKLFTLINTVWNQYNVKVSTGKMNRILENITKLHSPPYSGAKRLKFFYTTQVSVRPPTFVIFVNRPGNVNPSYRRYIMNQFREQFRIQFSPIKILFRER